MSTIAFQTPQEEFWAGDFGNEYVVRNQGERLVASNLALFSKALGRTHGVERCIEFGSNIGLNLKALQLLLPGLDISAIEINAAAVQKLSEVIPQERIFNQSILDFMPATAWDLVLIKGVLIHINPDRLPTVYEKLVESCSRYLLICEYYNPTPVTVNYRGNSDRLFKRDFAGEIMEKYPQMKLLDYGFVYKRDPIHPQDDANWFLLEKR